MLGTDDQQRDWAKKVMRRKRMKQADVLRLTDKLKKGMLSAWLAGERTHLGQDKFVELQMALREKFVPDVNEELPALPPMVRSESEQHVVPVVLASRFPAEAEEEPILRRIRDVARAWRACSLRDPEAFGIELETEMFEFQAGDQILFSPALQARRGDIVAAYHAGQFRIGELGSVGDQLLLRLASGVYLRDFRQIGTGADLWRSPIRRPV